MKKRHGLYLLVAGVLFVLSILPAFVVRISYEQQHKGYVTALELNDTAAQFDRVQLQGVLRQYAQNGMMAAVLREQDGGFDTALLSMAADAGLECVLLVYVGGEKPTGYEQQLERIIREYGVTYLVLKQDVRTNTHQAPLARLIEDYELTLVLSEKENQLSNESPVGFSAYVEAAQGRIMRSYETRKNPAEKLSSGDNDPDLVYYQMMNSARDRNTEFLLINQITHAAPTPMENAAVTQNAVAKFCAWMQRAGYTPGFSGTLAGYQPNLRAVNAAAACIGVLMLMGMLYVLLGKSKPQLEWVLFAVAVAVYLVSWIMPLQLVLLYPTLFAPLGACFGFTVAYACARRWRDTMGTARLICTVLAVSFVTLLLCCVVLSAMLSGMHYYLNIDLFRGVSLSLLLPVLYALALLLWKEERWVLRPCQWKAGLARCRANLRPWHGLLLCLAVVVLALYLLRSGNTSISGWETKLRNVMGALSLARPRTKEFLFGWPALALFVYYVKHGYSKLFFWCFAAAASILFASIINTFCHVFADVFTCMLRTVNGLALGIVVTLLACAINHIVVKILFSKPSP